jgi:membrane-bound ClpP family serine protease
MASLTIAIGAFSRSKTGNDDTKATNLFNDFAASIGATGTNAQRADAVLNALVVYMQEQAQRHRRNTQTVTALAQIQSELDALTWG